MAESVPLKEFQAFQLGILKEFMRLCEKHGLTYYAAFGTLLGAVRHQGFIPWDDDIDVWMPPEDYLRFRSACSASLADGYYFQSHGSNPCNFLSWQRIGVRNSTSLPKEYADIDAEWGVCIDVFPLVPSSSDAAVRRKVERRARRLCRLSSKYLYRHEAKEQRGLRKVYSSLMGAMPDVLNVRLWDSLSKKLLLPKDADRMDCYVGSFKENDMLLPLRADCFRDFVMLPFEDTSIAAPADYTDVLEALFGKTWNEFPPESERVGHSGGGSEQVIVSLTEPYRSYMVFPFP